MLSRDENCIISKIFFFIVISVICVNMRFYSVHMRNKYHFKFFPKYVPKSGLNFNWIPLYLR